MDAGRRFYISCIMLAVFVSAGCIGYMLIERVGLLEAAYMTIITISTVGFKEVFELSAGGKVFTMFLVMLGVGSVYYASVSLVTLFVSGELRSAREKLKVQKRISELKDHIVLCGHGRVGGLVAKQLSAESAAIVVLDNDPDKIAALEQAGVLCIEADASEEASLLEAGITRAKTLVATLPRDSDNVYVTLTARGLSENIFIIARAEATSTEGKLIRAGADRVVCPQVIGAYRISSLVTRPNVVDFVDVAAKGVELEIDEYLVSEDSALAGKSLRDSALRQKVDAMVVAIRCADGKTTFNPTPDEVIQAGDTLIMIGRLDTSTRLAQL